MNFEVWPEAIELGRMFAAEGYELALVGGPVRDLLLHRKSHDLDFCTSARPEQFEHILRRFGHDGFWDMGRKFGTLGAMRRREDGTEVKVEVTTYRSDTYDPDSRKPEVNYGDTLEGDLSRRDFTVNAMAVRINPDLPGGIGEFHDPLGGLTALADRVLVYGDCAVIPDPTSIQLADIAISSAATAAQFGVEPRVAMLSYSTGNSGAGSDVEKVREATRLAQEKRHLSNCFCVNLTLIKASSSSMDMILKITNRARSLKFI